MSTRVMIDSEYYGEAATYASIAEAEASLRSCGPDFESTRLHEHAGIVYDEESREVGYLTHPVDVEVAAFVADLFDIDPETVRIGPGHVVEAYGKMPSSLVWGHFHVGDLAQVREWMTHESCPCERCTVMF